MHHVVILGGGFAGVAAAKSLVDQHVRDVHITLIDQHPYHTFTPSLYELATSEEPQKNIAIPFKEIFGNKVHIVVGTVEKIDVQTNTVHYSSSSKNSTVIASEAKQSSSEKEIATSTSSPRNDENKKARTINYDFLIITLGSESAYFGIPGLAEFSMPLKSVDDAVAIRNKIKDVCCKEGVCHRKTQLLIGGGGFSGTELAAEMLMYKTRLARQNRLDKDCLEVSILQGSDRLLNELDPHVSGIATKRIAGLNVKFCFGGHIKEVTKSQVRTDDGKEYDYNILVWTGGVKANHVVKESGLPVSDHGQFLVNKFLQVNEFPNIFSGGDVTEFMDPKSGKPAPGVAQVAEEEGKVVGENVAKLIKGENLQEYTYRHFGYVVPLKGKYAAAELEGLHFDGFFAWVIQQLVFLRYLWGILPPVKALMRWNTFEETLFQ